MGRIYTNQSIAGAAGEGYLAGQKLAEDEKFRQEELAAKKSQLLQQAAKDILGTQYSEKPHDKRGNFTGYEVTPETRDKSNSYLKNIVPQFYEKPGNPGSPEVFSTESDRLKAKALGDMSGASQPAQPPAPPPVQPQPIQPLLKSKESAQAENDSAMADKQRAHDMEIAKGNEVKSLGEKKYIGTDGGTPKFEQAANTSVSFGDAVIAPEAPPTKNEFTPPDYMLGNIAKSATEAQAKDSDPLISMSTLPPEVKKLMGISPDFQGSMRSSVVKELLQAGSKKGAVVDKSISDRILPFVDKARKGAPLGQTLQEAAIAKGAPLNPEENRAITGESHQNASDKRFGLQQQKVETEKNKVSPKVEEKVNALENVKSYLQQAKELVDSGRVKPRAALDIARRFGVYGGVASDAANAAIRMGGGETLSADELQFLKLTAKANLDKLVSTAGTTFTEKFANKIDSLGTDVSDPKRFSQSIDFLINEADREKNNAIGIGQSNKRGEIGKRQQAAKEPSAKGLNPSEFRIEMKNATEALKAAKDDSARAKIKSMFKQRTGIDY